MKNKFKAFTLAEVMIVLMVIGILTAILLPAARNAMPNENVMKFKKAHNTLYSAIRELVNSDKYYLNGDLGIRPNGNLINGEHEGDITYFCDSLADVLNIKEKNCSSTNPHISAGSLLSEDHDIETEKQWLDIICIMALVPINSEIITENNITIFQPSPNETFGVDLHDSNINYCSTLTDPVLPDYCINSDWGYGERSYGGARRNNDGLDIAYKGVCVDIDGIPDDIVGLNSITLPESPTQEELNELAKKLCGNECPFGYGIRADGKILNGARAEEWLQKTIQEK